ncbi:Fructoselysine-6-P-deglycase FrlB with duplicated sugar isomerase (SIS) domain [Fontibacillus panacisegetis]|uniref:Fructosamine deglycase n=1 Tax=Fontibacillus panacisegetis TaxID=670482 RepID=A0A1G7GXM8_9BACL|nr:SIS domain-containing protein [Fontibacillus panacisegetis]SDE92897.1 Fructoselysine-6-P-deglycase FrlB with duplicated sugar isomerase (SIS) domain [Fontibacillus panacisegetis]
MDVVKVINSINEQTKNGISEVYLVACGGSLVDMYPSKYFLESEAQKIVTGMYTANEFVHALPKRLNKDSLVIVCSHGGNTPESVEASKTAKEHGAHTIGLTHNKEAALLQYSNHAFLYEWGEDSDVKNNPMAIILSLCVEVLKVVEGYEHYEAFQNGMGKVNGIISEGKKQVGPRTKAFADKYGSEELFYILSSGASYGHAYGFAICSLMEMQWLNAASIHSGEYFHGPFEVTDKETPFILMMNEGRTRALDERALKFLNQYAGKVEVVDAKELGIGTIAEEVVEFFNPILFYSILCEYREALATVRNHPLETRRYMGKVAY